MPAFFRLALTTVAVKSLLPNFPHDPLAWIIHEDSASRGNLAKQVGQSSEKRGSPRAEEDRPDVTPDFLLASNRHTAILKKLPIK